MFASIARNPRVHANAQRLVQNPLAIHGGVTEQGMKAEEALLAPLLKLNKKDKPHTIQTSSVNNKIYEKIHLRAKKEDAKSSTTRTIFDTMELVIGFLNKTDFRLSKTYHPVDGPTASIERDVADRNEAELFPLIVDLINQLLPEGWAVAHYSEETKADGRTDHVIVLFRLKKPYDALQLAKADPEEWATIPPDYNWTIAGGVDADIQTIVIIEDKFRIRPLKWSAFDNAVGPLETQSREIRLYGSQLIRYARLFACRYIVLNDGEFYFTYCLNADQVKALCDAPDVNNLPGKLDGTYAEYGLNNARLGLLTTTVAALMDVFGKFDGKKWDKGGVPRGTPWYVVDPKDPAGLPKVSHNLDKSEE